MGTGEAGKNRLTLRKGQTPDGSNTHTKLEEPRDEDVTKAPARRIVSQKTWDLKDDPTTAPETQTEQPKPTLENR